VTRIQHVLNDTYAILFYPFQERDPVWLMLWLSVLASLLVLVVYKVVSSQEAMRKTKDRLKAHILEIRLFQDDPVLMARAVRSVLAANLTYLRLNTKPFLVVFVPLFLLLIQMEARFGYRPLVPNESALVRTFWRSPCPADAAHCPSLIPEEGLSVRTPPLRIAERNEIDWRIRAEAAGRPAFVLKTMNDSVPLLVVVSDKLIPVSPRNVPQGSVDLFWHPMGQSLPAGSDVLSAEIEYPRRDFRLLGYRMHWIWPFLVLSLLSGYLLKGVFRVQF
jgi:hypothetical protein